MTACPWAHAWNMIVAMPQPLASMLMLQLQEM